MPVDEHKTEPRLTFYHRHRSLLLGALAGGLVFALATSARPTASNLLIGWLAGVAIYLVLAWYRMLGATADEMRRRAASLDSSDSLLLMLASAATLASMGGIAVEMHGLKDGAPGEAWLHAAFAGGTILMSWLFLHTLFTVHYAHRYYAGPKRGGGLKFPDDPPEPEFWDFLYFSFTIGVAAQTADVAVSSAEMRRLTLAHSVLSFFFNTTILALAVNVGASLV